MNDTVPRDTVLHDLAALDGAVYAAVAATDTPALDAGLRRLSHAANNSKINLSIAAALTLLPGRCRTAGLAGAAAVGLASFSANLLGKSLVRRPRPDREAAQVRVDRHVPMPSSASFPSGHTASAFALATTVGTVLPVTAAPLGLLACAVGYSRVHTGVHYPGDVIAGALLGTTCASVVLGVARRLTAPQ
ncbi:phosphatase PAP2 family protein [Streptacidiphilus melanogenes]|uniref:phosphatase PAP2 family protein n=1 Tax=Streptacidiphilus melanogenes TaxID=411235 RepID=UPI0005A7FFA6|nr:phosphatase PAP2 family protein [Streptacidiphilus melanogenes]